jgi:soluble lytic murein transglycosylase-like protein
MSLANSSLSTPKAAAQRAGGFAIDGEVLHGIRQASRKTGVDFGYLMAQAAQESGFRPEIKAATSSATGLYQFIDSTWLGMVREAGAKHGLGDLAAKVRGDGSVADPQVRRQILELRKDPKVSALIGAEFALSNKQHLEQALGRNVGAAELYMAHFLGAGGATRFLQAVDRNANLKAADMMPQAAAANRWVFFDRETGAPRSVGDIYKMFQRSIDVKSTQFAELADGAPTGFAAARGGQPHDGRFAAYRAGAAPGPANLGPIGPVDIAGPTQSLFAILSMLALDLPGAGSLVDGDAGPTDAGRDRDDGFVAYRRLDRQA